MKIVIAFLFLNVFACSSLQQQTSSRKPAGGDGPEFFQIGGSDNPLETAWKIQSSEGVQSDGVQISQPEFSDASWYAARVPSTVLGNLVDDGMVGLPIGADPYFGTRLKNLMGVPPFSPLPNISGIFVSETPTDSPFGRSWWYRREFTLPLSASGSDVSLTLNGMTYGADVWVNGSQIAKREKTLGSYREFQFEIASFLNPPGKKNVIAIQVWPPLPHDLSTTWVDWNLTPQDKNMGLWRGASLSIHGPVEINHPMVTSTVSKPRGTFAELRVEANLKNPSLLAVKGQVLVEIDGSHFSKWVSLAPRANQKIVFLPSEFSKLKFKHPLLWWPAQMGTPNLYRLKMEFKSSEVVSTEKEIDFGIRQITSDFNSGGARQFYINGKPLLIRGGGWSPDLFMRYTTARIESEMNYVLDMGLNTIRQEGTIQPDSFYSIADRKGILVMPGLTCCNGWQMDADKWDATKREIARKSFRDILLSLRAHPSVFTFLYGSDDAPPPAIEKMYLGEINAVDWPNPVVASAAASDEDETKTGVKMNGPYDYVPPAYWLTDKKEGGAFGFNTETSPGASIPPMQSLKKFLPAENLDHIDDVWNFHAGENGFSNINVHTDALAKTFGPLKNMNDMVDKSQLLDYDAHRAMFEAFNRNKDRGATGIVQWMLNNSFPSIIWHLYDYYLQPGAAYFGVKEANRPLHLLYGYDNQQISLVNSTYVETAGLHASAQVYDMDSHLISSREITASSLPNGSEALFPVMAPGPVRGGIYFLSLRLTNSAGRLLDSNFYWLPVLPPELPLKIGSVAGDFSALASLAKTEIKISSSWDPGLRTETIELTNPSDKIALFINLRLTHGAEQKDLLPILWDDNDITLLPKEHRTLKAILPEAGADLTLVEIPEVHGTGWNVNAW